MPRARTAITEGPILRALSLSFGFVSVQQALSGAFRGSGSTFISMVLAVISLWVLHFPLASRDLG